MTSRSEYRLILRQDNADVRLTPIGHELGLIDEERWQKFLEKQAQVEGEIKRLQGLTIVPSDALNAMLVSRETVPLLSLIHIWLPSCPHPVSHPLWLD